MIDPTIRLKPDSVIEALLELRFVHPEVAELVVGKLATTNLLPNPQVQRLPLADFPAPLRCADPNLAFQPIFELRAGERVLKVGEQVLSYHVLPPYPGWSVLSQDLRSAVQHVFSNVQTPRITRISLRYINVLKPALHQVMGIGSTNLEVTVSGNTLTERLNVNYQKAHAEHVVTVRVATPEFVEGPQRDFSLLLDVDVSTPAETQFASPDVVMAWTEAAHIHLKDEFFGLLKPDVLAALTER